MARLRLVILVSGRGSNLDALLAASRAGRMDADVVRVLSNKADAAALDVARVAGVEALVLPSAGLSRDEHERLLAEAIDAARPDLVCLAGYMRILGGAFIRRYQGRLLNIHPSLLPAFPGLDAQGQAARANVRIAGCTTHFVTEDVDAGPIVMQAATAIPPGADPETVRSRILALEHELYPATIQLIASGEARWHDGRVVAKPGARLALVEASP